MGLRRGRRGICCLREFGLKCVLRQIEGATDLAL